MGKVVVQLVIAPEGKVASSTVAASTVADEAVGSCVSSRARTWQFPTAESNTQVSATFVFNPGR